MSEPPRFTRSDYLQHIREACALILEYTRRTSKADFLRDRRRQQAVLLNSITIGEAATLLASERAAFVTSASEIPWHKMRGMRNVMAHEYWSVNVDVVWETIATSIPDPNSGIAELLST